MIVVTRGYFYVKEFVETWTPKEQRSRDKWREKGQLARIQTENGWSREEMAEHFRQEADAKLEALIPITTVIYNSADYVLSYLTPPRKKKK